MVPYNAYFTWLYYYVNSMVPYYRCLSFLVKLCAEGAIQDILYMSQLVCKTKYAVNDSQRQL